MVTHIHTLSYVYIFYMHTILYIPMYIHIKEVNMFWLLNMVILRAFRGYIKSRYVCVLKLWFVLVVLVLALRGKSDYV